MPLDALSDKHTVADIRRQAGIPVVVSGERNPRREQRLLVPPGIFRSGGEPMSIRLNEEAALAVAHIVEKYGFDCNVHAIRYLLMTHPETVHL